MVITHDGSGALSVTGRSSEEIARAAMTAGILLTELTPITASLEDAYLAMTHEDLEY